jgi:occludin/MAL family lipid-associated protein
VAPYSDPSCISGEDLSESISLKFNVDRYSQFLFAIIVLGLSITLAKGQVIGSVPATTGYGSFTGGLGILAAIIGFAALSTDFLEGIISWAIDGLAGVAFLAGGIVRIAWYILIIFNDQQQTDSGLCLC